MTANRHNLLSGLHRQPAAADGRCFSTECALQRWPRENLTVPGPLGLSLVHKGEGADSETEVPLESEEPGKAQCSSVAHTLTEFRGMTLSQGVSNANRGCWSNARNQENSSMASLSRLRGLPQQAPWPAGYCLTVLTPVLSASLLMNCCQQTVHCPPQLSGSLASRSHNLPP